MSAWPRQVNKSFMRQTIPNWWLRSSPDYGKGEKRRHFLAGADPALQAKWMSMNRGRRIWARQPMRARLNTWFNWTRPHILLWWPLSILHQLRDASVTEKRSGSTHYKDGQFTEWRGRPGNTWRRYWTWLKRFPLFSDSSTGLGGTSGALTCLSLGRWRVWLQVHLQGFPD